MYYKELLDECMARAEAYRMSGAVWNQTHEEKCSTATTDLLARVEEAESRAEKAEKERDAAIKERDSVAAAVDDLSDFIDEQIHPLVQYDMYMALRENADAISIWNYESEWRGQKEE